MKSCEHHGECIVCYTDHDCPICEEIDRLEEQVAEAKDLREEAEQLLEDTRSKVEGLEEEIAELKKEEVKNV